MNNSAILVALQGRVSQEALMAIQAKLDKISEDKLASLAFLDLKNPAISQVLAITLGGAAVDRFYRGQIGWGLLKLFTFGGMGIWAIIDIFLTAKGTRKDNFNKINSILSSY